MPTPTIWHIPYQRNPFFTGREEVLNQLHRALQADATVALSHPQGISGLGGIGKTQTALEYAYRYAAEYEAVLWVRADSIISLTSSLVELAHKLELPERNEQDQALIVQAVLRWLRNNTGWLLIYDNIDDFSLAEPFLPKAGTGHLLFTTRAYTLSGLAERLDIQKMEPVIGALLLLRRAAILPIEARLETATSDDQRSARTLSQELDGLPLALDQAGAYMKEVQCSLAEYLARYQSRRSDLLRERGSFDQDYPASVATTWSLSFEKVRQTNPASAELLNFCAFLAPDAIPEKMITQGAGHLPPLLREVVTHPLQFDTATTVLLNYSLLHRNINETLDIHRLVQAVLRNDMPVETQKLYMQQAVYTVEAVFTSEETSMRWSIIERCLPHALTCVTWIEQEQMIFPEAATLPFKAGHALKERAKYVEAEPLFKCALEIWEQVLETDNALMATCLDGLGQIYKKQGKHEQAKAFYNRALQIFEQQLGNSHYLTATTLNNLAALYESMGKDKQAEQFYQHSLRIRQQVLGDNHLDTAASRKNLADLYVSQGKYAEAEPLLQHSLATCEKLLELDDPRLNMIRGSMAKLYKNQRKYAKAETLYRYVLALNERSLSFGHPNTVITLNNLAALYYEQERYTEAEQIWQRVLTIDENIWGSEHLELARDLNNLASLYDTQKKYELAEPLFQRALAITEQWLGTNHPDTASILSNLAALYVKQKKYEQVEPLLLRALAINKQQDDHLSMVPILNNLGSLYKELREYGEAELFYWRALEISEQHLGVDHPNAAIVFSNLGNLYASMSKDTNEKWLRNVHSDTAARLHQFAYAIYEKKGKYAEAEPFYLCTLEIWRQMGDDGPMMAVGFNNLAQLYARQGNYVLAEALYRRALEIAMQQFGSNDPATLKIRDGYTRLLQTMEEIYKNLRL